MGIRLLCCSGSRSVEHVGEWKVAIWSVTLAGVFRELARVIARACGSMRGPSSEWEQIKLSARDTETLLVNWANELLGRSEISQRAYRQVRHLHIDHTGLTGQIRGWQVTSWESPLKAATFHGLSLERRGMLWRATILLDV